MYDKCYFCLDQLPKLKKESTASFFVNFGGAGVQKSRPTLLYIKIEELLTCAFHLSDQETYKVEKRSQGYFKVEDNDSGEKDDQRQGQLLRQGKM